MERSEVTQTAVEFRRGPGALALWWGALAGPVAFALDETLSYATVQHSCSTGGYAIEHFYTVLAILISLSGMAAAQWCYRRIPNSVSLEQGSTESRSRWMAIYGIAASIVFIVVIIALSIPKWAMSPCDQ
jgi:hypothetical protein